MIQLRQLQIDNKTQKKEDATISRVDQEEEEEEDATIIRVDPAIILLLRPIPSTHHFHSETRHG